MFGHPNQNRRRRPSHQTLMARLRSQSSESGRPWILRLLGRCLVLSAFIAGLLFGAQYLQKNWAYHIPSLAIQKILIKVNGSLPFEEVLRLSGLTQGRNILDVDLPQLRDRLEQHPRVAYAQIMVEFPGTILISIQERFPLAVVEPLARNGLSARYLLDKEGHILWPLNPAFCPAETVSKELALPKITGRTSGSLTTTEDTLTALKFLQFYRLQATNLLPEITSVSISIPRLLVVTTTEGSEITFASPTLETQLHRWKELHRHMKETGDTRIIRTLDLSVSRNAPIRWKETAPAQALKDLKPSVRPKYPPKISHV